MKTLRTKKTALLLLATLACSSLAVGAGMWKETAKAEDAVDATRFSLVNGAAVRIANNNGIRFTVEMGADVYDSIVNLEQDVVSTKAGMFVVPYAFVNNANAYTDQTVGHYQNFVQKIDLVFYDSNNPETNKIYQDGDYYYANGAVVDMKFANLDLDYIGIGYIETTTETATTYEFTSFTEEDNARSIARVAGSAYAFYEDGATIPTIISDYVYGALLGELKTNVVSYNEETKLYTYNAQTYDSVSAIMEATNATSVLSLNNAALSMLPTTSTTLKATMSLTVNGETSSVATGAKFTSDNQEVATVDAKTGKVKAIGIGTANITATTMGKTATCVVTVEDKREAKTLTEADFDLSKKENFVTTLDNEQELINVTVGGVDVTEYATLTDNKLSVSLSAMQSAGMGEKEVVIGTSDYVYTQDVTVATYVITDKASFDKFHSAHKTDNESTDTYYVVLAKNAIIDLEGATYTTNASSNHFLGVFDGRGATLKNFKTSGGGLFGRTSLKSTTKAATLMNFALVNVTGTASNGALFVQNINNGYEKFSNIYIQGTITSSGSSVFRALWNSKSQFDNIIVNVTNSNNDTTALFGGSGSNDSTQGVLNNIYGISNVNTLVAGSKVTGTNNNNLYKSEVDFFKNVTALPTEDGWAGVWSFDAAGNLCFGGNIIMTKPDMRQSKDLGEAYYQKGSTEDLTIALDAGEVVTSVTVGSNNVTDIVDKSTAGQVTVPAAAIATLTTGEYEVAISTQNYKYSAEFVYADLVISTPAEWCEFLTLNRNGDILKTYQGEYIVLKEDIDFTNFDYKTTSPTTGKAYAAWVNNASAKALNVTGNGPGKAAFGGTLDGRGHAVINFGAVTSVFDKLTGATIKDVAFIGLDNTFAKNALGLAYIPQSSACTFENVFVSVKQNGANYQTGLFRESWTTANVKNVIVVKLEAAGAATNYGFSESGATISNSYAINATYTSATKTDGITTANALLADTSWLNAENGWNTDVWTIDASGNLCFGGDIVVSK